MDPPLIKIGEREGGRETLATFSSSLGAIADVDLVVRCKNIKDDIMVVSQQFAVA